ncbi:thiol-disulfide oxidoreductase [Planctomycetes bacterium Pla163]|uniref:Thiol-disulfide oxidoreductase n=1 Tax=Rohdeia mirabilis TaxID=2528008 RepID=A0A518D3E4_9BACT|nr:thiol-disulfide oxidoreductase [Planctomycetes bacterium Pla163]
MTLLTLLVAIGTLVPTADLSISAPVAPPLVAQERDDAVASAAQDLIAEFDAALAAYDARYAAADREARKELRDEHPAALFWQRFDDLAGRGSWRAVLWQVEHVRHGGLKSKERRAFAKSAFEGLRQTQVREPAFEHVLNAAREHRRSIGDELYVRMLTDAVQWNPTERVKACALFNHGLVLVEEGGDSLRRGLTMLDDCAERFGNLEYGRRAKEEAFATRNLRIGGTAPDFAIQTFEGETFRLSDHRGKVVVLDFFGFW